VPFREFVGCRDRIERAKAHSKAFARAWSAFLENDPYSPYLHIDDDGTGTISVGHGYGALPNVFALVLGELLYQLRAALDGAIYGAAILETGDTPPPNYHRLEFPICRSAEQFKASSGKLGPLAKRRRAIIESVQPYTGPKDVRPEVAVFGIQRTLSILNDWARKDRHRTLHVVGSWASSADPLLVIPAPATLS
jgi:hypothetical protein